MDARTDMLRELTREKAIALAENVGPEKAAKATIIVIDKPKGEAR